MVKSRSSALESNVHMVTSIRSKRLRVSSIGSDDEIVATKMKKMNSVVVSKKAHVVGVKTKQISKNVKKGKKKVGGEDGVGKKEKKVVAPPIVKEGECYILPEQRLPARIVYDGFNGDCVLDNIRRVLSQKQLEMFSVTCFGHFLNLKPLRLQLNLVHSLLLREIKQSNENELWVEVSGRPLRFGLGDFSLVTGLNISSNEIKSNFKVENPTLRQKFFGITKRVTKGLIEQVFISGNFLSDHDAVMLAVLYFLECYLLSGPKNKNVSDSNFDIVESGGFQNYCWGREIFLEILRELRGRLRSWKDDLNARRKWFYYCVKHFVLSFQVWFFECCPFVDGRFAVRSGGQVSAFGDDCPRMVRWSCWESKSFDELRTELFSHDARTLGLSNLVPSKHELDALGLESFFYESVCDDVIGNMKTPKSSSSCSVANKEGDDNESTTMNIILRNQTRLFKNFRSLESKFDSLSKDVSHVLEFLKKSYTLKELVSNFEDDGEEYEGGDKSFSDNDDGDNEVGENVKVLEEGVDKNVGGDVGRNDDVEVGKEGGKDVEEKEGGKDVVEEKVVGTSLKSDDFDSDFMKELEKVEKDIISALKSAKKVDEDDNVKVIVDECE